MDSQSFEPGIKEWGSTVDSPVTKVSVLPPTPLKKRLNGVTRRDSHSDYREDGLRVLSPTVIRVCSCGLIVEFRDCYQEV